MPTLIADRVRELGHILPAATSPVANYVSTVRSGSLLFVSGQISQRDGAPAFIGRVGAELTLEEGKAAALAAALGVLAQIAAVTDGAVDSIARVVRLGVFIAAAPGFTSHAQVANGASDLICAVFGAGGRHCRTTIGVASLPQGASAELDAIVELAT